MSVTARQVSAWWKAGPPAWRETWAWRGVEAQHAVSTMRLVDSLAEQEVLEQLLEQSKPAVPAAAAGKHYLLFTPFRYRSPFESRFRTTTDPGVWYGAEERDTACAEVAWWRWRFLMDSAALRDGELLSGHTFFRARVAGQALDLSTAPWSKGATAWTAEGYAATQALAMHLRQEGGDWIRYASTRLPGGTCCAVLHPGALTAIDAAGIQTWHCRTTRGSVRMVHQSDKLEWSFP